MSAWFTLHSAQTWHINVHAQPSAARTEVVGLHAGALKIRVAAPPLEDRANAELVRFLAHCFAVPKRNVVLLRGDKSRRKQFAIEGSLVKPGVLLGEAGS